MTSKIRVLQANTINKIAAGEVIENPASVVKELVENSLDAGSTEITIEILTGGRQLIRISDNGCGMNLDDALLCLERHATSKIREFEELHEISTMGFRGEAVPSIASISKFMIITCPRPEENNSKAPEGTMVIVDGGNIIKCCSAERSSGTTIEVKSLFFNVPVRKKFQKAPAYDSSEILKTVGILAMGYPHIKFQLISDHNLVLNTALPHDVSFQEALHERILSILGKDLLESLKPIDKKLDQGSLQGYIGLPTLSRNNRTGQYLFINNRAVASPLIAKAILEGYGTALDERRYPFFVLHLHLPGSLVDVNVHPQKREVRISQELNLKDRLRQGVQEALQGFGVSHTQPVDFSSFEIKSEEPRQFTPSFGGRNFEYDPFQIDFSADFKPAQEEELTPKHPPRHQIPSCITPVLPPTASSEQIREQVSIKDNFKNEIPDFLQTEVFSKSPKVLATLERYIILDGTSSFSLEGSQKSGLWIVDQRSAHLRVLYERLLAQLSTPQQVHPEMQNLLLPIMLDLSLLEAKKVSENLKYFHHLGISIREFGPQAFVIDALAPIFEGKDIPMLIADILQELHEDDRGSLLQKEKENRLALAAGRAAIGNDKRLSVEEAQGLIDRLMKCVSPYKCPLGRSTIMSMSLQDIAKYFQR